MSDLRHERKLEIERKRKRERKRGLDYNLIALCFKLWGRRLIQWLMMLQLAVVIGLHQAGFVIGSDWEGISVGMFFMGFVWYVNT